MNREFKFRVWSPKDNSLRYLPKIEAKIISWGSVKIESTDDERNEGTFWNYEEAIIQQFTGLKDKNGKEIYEGDLLKISEKDRPEYFKDYCHVWYSDSGCFTVSFNHLYSETSCDLYMVNLTYEVIGNIFENPDLLK